MATALQLDANRSSAQHSTGLKTESGKAASATNALRHGLASAQLITFWESPEKYDALLADLVEEHQPATTTETLLVQQMAQHHWLTQRAIFLQRRVIKDAGEPVDAGKKLEVFVRYQTTNERAFHKALAVLTKLQSERKKQGIGFVSQESAPKPLAATASPHSAPPPANGCEGEASNAAGGAQLPIKKLDLVLSSPHGSQV